MSEYEMVGKEVVALSLEDQGLAEGCGVISPIEPQTEIPAVPAPDVLTLGKLIEQYQTDPVSGWHNLRFATRRNQETVLRRWAAQYGDRTIASLRRRDLDEMYHAYPVETHSHKNLLDVEGHHELPKV